MRNEFLKNGYYYNFFGDLMQLMHRILEKQDNEALDALYNMTGGFYHKYPQPYTSAVLLAIDHELVRRPYLSHLTEAQYKEFLKEYYIMLKDVLGLKAEQLSSDDLCAYALDQMDTLQKKYQKYSGTSEHWKFGYDLLLFEDKKCAELLLHVILLRKIKKGIQLCARRWKICGKKNGWKLNMKLI